MRLETIALFDEYQRATGAGPMPDVGPYLERVDDPAEREELRRRLEQLRHDHGSVPEAIGPYRIIGPELGRGGMGRVFRARRGEYREDVALKLIDTRITPQNVRRFEEEYEKAKALRGLANIVAVWELGRA